MRVAAEVAARFFFEKNRAAGRAWPLLARTPTTASLYICAMLYYSTKGQSPDATLEEAVLRGLPPDNGLYMPREIRPMPAYFFDTLGSLAFPEIALEVADHLISDDVPRADLQGIVDRAFDFDSPLTDLGGAQILELWHGPSMAFKDFGARFMAGLMGHFLERKKQEVRILVATSGDTGGAVAQGFFNVPGINVTILYPSGRVSPIQEKQLTTLGGNISAIEISGDFDDCQRLVKQAFLDPDLTSKMTLASANSINIARLIPQAFYYFRAYGLLTADGGRLTAEGPRLAVRRPPSAARRPPSIVFSVPSGNFGNLSAGVWAWRLGLPVAKFIAASNANDAVPRWLSSGEFAPQPTVPTLSNAMDVGNPSNFPRLEILSEKNSSGILTGASFTDKETAAAIRSVHEKTGYEMCPHTAVAWLGWEEFKRKNPGDHTGVVLSTAHAAKFPETMEKILGRPVEMPARLAELLEKEKRADRLPADFGMFKNWLLSMAA